MNDLNDIELTISQRVRVNDCLIQVASLQEQNEVDPRVELQLKMHQSDDKITVYTNELIPHILHGNSLENDLKHSLPLEYEYYMEVFKFYLSQVDASRLALYLVQIFDDVPLSRELVAELLLKMSPFLGEAESLNLVEFCVEKLRVTSNVIAPVIEVRNLVQLMSSLSTKVEGTLIKNIVDNFLQELSSHGLTNENAMNVLLLILCVFEFRANHYNQNMSTFLLSCIKSNNPLYIRRALFIYDKAINAQERRYLYLYKNDAAFVNVFSTTEFEHELHLIEQLFPTISKLVKIASNAGEDSRKHEKCIDLINWEHLEPLFSRLFHASHSPAIKKLVVKAFFTGLLGFDQQNIKKTPPAFINILVHALNSLGGNVNVNKYNKKNEHFSLLDELLFFIENLVQQTNSLVILESIEGFKFAITMKILEGISRASSALVSYKNMDHLRILSQIVIYQLKTNLPPASRSELIDVYASIIICFDRPFELSDIKVIMGIVTFDPRLNYVIAIKNWINISSEDVSKALNHEADTCTDVLANICCFSSSIEVALNYACDNHRIELMYAIMLRNPPCDPLTGNKIENMIHFVINETLSLVKGNIMESSPAEISNVLVRNTSFLKLLQKRFKLKGKLQYPTSIVQDCLVNQNHLLRLVGIFSALFYAEINDYTDIIHTILYSFDEITNLGRNENTIMNVCKWGILSFVLPKVLTEQSEKYLKLSRDILVMAENDLLKVPTVAIFSILDCSVHAANYSVIRSISSSDQLRNLLQQYWDQILYLKGSVTSANFHTYAYKFIDLISDEKLMVQRELVLDYFGTIVRMNDPGITRKLLGNFAPLWLRYPDLLNLYREFILEFSIHKEQRVQEAYENHDFVFESDFLHILKNTDYYSLNRTIILTFFTQLPESSTYTLEFTEWIVLELLKICAANENGRDNLLIGSPAYSRKLRAWQALYVLCPLIPCCNPSFFAKIKNLLSESIGVNLHSKIRYFLEIFIMVLAKRCHENNDGYNNFVLEWLIDQVSCPTLTLQNISSLMLILGWLLVSGFIPSNADIKRLLTSILPWLGATQGFTRGIAQLLVHELIPLIDISRDETHLLSSVFRYLANNNDMQKLRKKQMSFFKDHQVVHSIESLLSIPVDESHEPTPLSQIEIIETALQQCYNEKYSIGDDEDQDIPLWKQLEKLTVKDIESETNDITDDDADANFQRKIIPLDLLHLSAYEEIRSSHLNAAGNPKQSLILCASLIDKTPNLAGLSRTAEIFAAEAIVVPDISIRKRDDFKGMSVGAGDHITMEECKEENLLSWLQKKKNNGYKIVGIEQTSSSQCISITRFPEKVVLLLGKEKEGIPVEYLQLVDVCVEIPQFGIIRSLNVHVSGAIAIWEYTRQNITKGINS